MSIPRVLSLRKSGDSYKLIQTPVMEMKTLRGEATTLSNMTIDGETSLSSLKIGGEQLELIATLEVGNADQCGLKFRVGENEATVVGYDVSSGHLFVDRTKSGETDFHPAFAGKHKAPLKPVDGMIKLHIFVDASSIEVFADDGATVLTERIFPDPGSVDVHAFAHGGKAKLNGLKAWKLNSVWR